MHTWFHAQLAQKILDGFYYLPAALKTFCNSTFDRTNDQLIWKCLFGVFNSPKKRRKTITISLVVKPNFFVRFLGELKIPKGGQINSKLCPHSYLMHQMLLTNSSAFRFAFAPGFARRVDGSILKGQLNWLIWSCIHLLLYFFRIKLPDSIHFSTILMRLTARPRKSSCGAEYCY